MSGTDPDDLAEQARKGCVSILGDVLAKGVSLYGGDDEGNVIELAPDERKFVVELRGEQLVRVSEIPQ